MKRGTTNTRANLSCRMSLVSTVVKVMVKLLGILLFTPTLLHGLKSIPMSDVQAVIKETANLPCDISIPNDPATSRHPDDDVILVLWYREDLGRPIYSVDARDRPFLQAERWSDENVFGNRAYFHSGGRPAQLTIENVVHEDQGIYRCRVDFRVAQTRNSQINLTIIVPPEQPLIVDEKGLERTLFVGPYTEGAPLTLHCHVKGGIPPPVVVWYRNGKLIDTSDFNSNGIVKNDLNIAILARSDLHAELTCEASNNNISRPLATTVHLDMNFSPIEVSILGKSSRITAGKKYDLLCQSVGSRPPAHITWWLDDRRLESSKETTSKDGNTTTSALTLLPQKEDSGKALSCRAENSIIPSKVLDDGWKLEVLYAPETRLKLGSSLSGDHIKEGSDVYFDCVIDANPPVTKVDWRHNGKLLGHNISAGVIMTNQSLVLQRVTRVSAGNYTCIGKNSEGDGESSPFFLDVLYSPTCRPNQVRVHGVAKVENANISCDVDANPAVVSFRWTFNNSAESIDVPGSRYRSSGTRSIVIYTPMTELDYGTLLCWATNKIGDQRVPCVYHIIAAGRPDSVHNCSVANHSTDSFFLQCNEGFNGGLPQYFILELYEITSQTMRTNLSSSIPAFSATGLEPGLSFLAHVYAANNKGRSELTVVPAFTMRLPEKILTREKPKPPSAPFQLNQTLSILIGACAALVIVFLIILVLRYYCFRVRRQRRREKASTPLKIDASEGCDSDEKNPDVIPQDPDEVEYYRKRQQHISTIDTSPARVTPGGLSEYCTLRLNGSIPLQELNHIGPRPKYVSGQEDIGYGTNFSSGCPTLPRHQRSNPHHQVESSLIDHHPHTMEWPSYQSGGPTRRHHIVATQTLSPHAHGSSSSSATSRLSSFRPIVAQVALSYDLPPLPQMHQLPGLDEESMDSPEMPLMSTADKIESTV